MRMETDPHWEPTILVIFGAAGDLTWRKLVPALFNLYLDRQLPEPFAMIGLDQQELSDDRLRRHLREGVERFSRRGTSKDADWAPFAARLSYVRGDLCDPTTYAQLGERLTKLDKEWHTRSQHVYYLAVPPFLFGSIATSLGKAGLAREPGAHRKGARARLVIEKPLGHDLESARATASHIGYPVLIKAAAGGGGRGK